MYVCVGVCVCVCECQSVIFDCREDFMQPPRITIMRSLRHQNIVELHFSASEKTGYVGDRDAKRADFSLPSAMTWFPKRCRTCSRT